MFHGALAENRSILCCWLECSINAIRSNWSMVLSVSYPCWFSVYCSQLLRYWSHCYWLWICLHVVFICQFCFMNFKALLLDAQKFRAAVFFFIDHFIIMKWLSSSLMIFLALIYLNDWRRKWQPTLVFLPGKSHGQRSPHSMGSQESDMT